jgi:hypothetical protein
MQTKAQIAVTSGNDSLPFIPFNIGIFDGYGWAQLLHSWR